MWFFVRASSWIQTALRHRAGASVSSVTLLSVLILSLLRLNLVEYLNAVVQIIAEASPPFCRSTFSFIINQLHETRFRAATGSAFEPLPRPTFYYPFNLCSPGLQPAWGYEKWYAQGIEIRLMPEVYTNADTNIGDQVNGKEISITSMWEWEWGGV